MKSSDGYVRIGLLLGLALLITRSGWAQAAEDSLLSYDLTEIVVSGSQVTAVSALPVSRLPLAELAQSDAATVDQITRLIPSAHAPTNSRGETLIYVRNSGERQTAFFFDGALLNVPWDQRFDLSLVPAPVIGQVSIAKGAPSTLYGTNVTGGAVSFTSRTLQQPGSVWEATARGGTAGNHEGYLTHLGRTERVNYALAAGYAARDGFALAHGTQLPYSQSQDDLRTNTDVELLNLFGQVGYAFDSGARLGVAALHLDGDKGIAPEGHLNPAMESVRYWRYPMWQTSMLILNGEVPLNEHGTRLRGAAWGSRFAQQIEQFESVAYAQRVAMQDDEDFTAGTRLILLHPTMRGEWRLALNALTSRHNQVDTEVGAEDEALDLTYRQHVLSGGVEYERQLTVPLSVIVGASVDAIATPETGDKPARDPQTSGGLTTALLYDLNEAWSWRVSGGRKVRFPTMRELFGESLDRFVVNPDLLPETSWLAETGIVHQGTAFSGEANVFLSRTFDTIDRRNVEIDGERKRQRVNLEGSRVYGVEVIGATQPLPGWRLDGHMTWLHARAYDDGATVRLAEKPEWLGTLTSTYQYHGRLALLLQGVYTGRAYSLDETNTFVALPTSLVLNTRLAYRLIFNQPRFLSAELFMRVNNITDEVVMPQLGLPAPGRELQAGVSLSL